MPRRTHARELEENIEQQPEADICVEVEKHPAKDDGADGLRAQTQRLREILDEDSALIARELYDDLGQELTAMRYAISSLRRRSNTGLERALDELEPLLDQASGTMKRITTRLRPPVLDQLGLDAAARWLLDHITAKAGIKSELVVDAELDALTSADTTMLYYIIREVLVSVINHSTTTHVVVTITDCNDRIVLTVADDGCGVPSELARPEDTERLAELKKRIDALEGKVDWINTPKQGTIVTITVPLRTF